MKTSRACLLALSASALVTGRLHGQAVIPSIFIDDTQPNDTVTIGGTDFTTRGGTFLVNGLAANNGQPIAEGAAGVSTPITFTGTWNLDVSEQGVTGSRTVYLVEAQDPDLISDILTVSYDFVPANTDLGTPAVETINGSFLSDFEDNLGTISGLAAQPLPGDVFTENSIPASFSNPILTGQIASDVDPTVPEPSTWAACGFVALLAGGTLVRRFRR